MSEEMINELRCVICKVTNPVALIVEDNPNDVYFLSLELAKFNVSSVVANTAADAVAKLKEKNFSICLLDLKLPDSTNNPVELVESLVRANPRVPIAIVTGSLDDKALRQILETKVLAVWLKPVTKQQLEGVFPHES